MKIKAKKKNNVDRFSKFSLNRNELKNIKGGGWIQLPDGTWIKV